MATSIHETLIYPSTTVDTVAALAVDPAFRSAVATYQHALRSSLDVTPTSAGKEVRFEYVHGTDRVPSFAKKLAGDEIPIVQAETWSGSEAQVLITIPGKPGDMRGTIKLEQRGDDVAQVVDLTVKVGIPFVGGKIEDLIAGLLTKAARAENKVGVRWLAGEWQA
jgi:hypothetical protein